MNFKGWCVLLGLVILLGCSHPETNIDVGASKEDVLRALGKPTAWVMVPAAERDNISVATVFSVESLRGQRMAPDETWILEFVGRDGKKYCLHLRSEKVVARVEGAALKE